MCRKRRAKDVRERKEMSKSPGKINSSWILILKTKKETTIGRRSFSTNVGPQELVFSVHKAQQDNGKEPFVVVSTARLFRLLDGYVLTVQSPTRMIEVPALAMSATSFQLSGVDGVTNTSSSNSMTMVSHTSGQTGRWCYARRKS